MLWQTVSLWRAEAVAVMLSIWQMAETAGILRACPALQALAPTRLEEEALLLVEDLLVQVVPVEPWEAAVMRLAFMGAGAGADYMAAAVHMTPEAAAAPASQTALIYLPGRD
jgi:hypothetical protein